MKPPWGFPSDKITIGKFQNSYIAFLPRHGCGHYHPPSSIPYKANLAALKILGIQKVVAFSAVGSLEEQIIPGHFVLPNQIIDQTKNREYTFYNEGIVVHIAFGDPFTQELANIIETSMKELQFTYHTNKTLICIEGPSFSTRAESTLYKSWGAHIINMTTIPEAKLARELELPYQTICMATDYDSWRIKEKATDCAEILEVIAKNSNKANILLENLLPNLVNLDLTYTVASQAVKNSIITQQSKWPPTATQKLKKVLPTYFEQVSI